MGRLILPRRALIKAGAASALVSSIPREAQAALTTWSTTDKTSNVSLSNSNLTAALTSAAEGGVRSSLGCSSGKVFFELTLGTMNTSTNYAVGIANASFVLTDPSDLGGSGSNSVGFFPTSSQQIWINNAVPSSDANPDAAGDVLGIAVDFGAQLFWLTSPVMVANGQPWNNSSTANPGTGSGGISFSSLTGGSTYFVAWCDNTNGSSITANFGASAFNHTVPSGFVSWNTQVNGGTIARARPRIRIVAAMGPQSNAAQGAQGAPTGGGTGPTATSAFLTADFSSAFNYPNGGTGQQIVSQRMWGTSTGGAGNNNFNVLSIAAYQTAMAKANPGLWYFKDSTQAYWSTDGNLTVQPSVVANLVNNFYKVDPLGISGVIIGCDFSQVPGGNGNTDVWSTGMANLASYLYNFTMPNGRKFPLLGMMGQDEPNTSTSLGESGVAAYYNALSPKLHAISSNLLLVGPNNDYIGWGDFGSQVSGLGVFSYDYYQGGNNYAYNDLTPVTSNNFTSIGSSASSATAVGIVMFGGYNIDWNCQAPAENSYVGALFIARGMIDSLNQTNRPFWACVWDAWGDGTCGIVTDPGQQPPPYGSDGKNYLLTPKGYLYGATVPNIYGARWNIPTNSSGMRALAVTPSSSRCAMLVVNVGNGTQTSQPVALSHWPVNNTGNGTVNIWQMGTAASTSGIDGTKSTAAVSNGIATISFPDPSITVIYT